MAEPADRRSEAPTQPIDHSSRRSDLYPGAAGALGLTVALFCLAWLSFSAAGQNLPAAPVWPATAVLLGILLGTRPTAWPAYGAGAALACALAALANGHHWLPALGFAAATTAEAALAAAVLRRMFAGDVRITDVRPLLVLFAIGALAVACAGGIIAALALHLAEGVDFGRAWLGWTLSSATGIVVFCPLVLSWRDPGTRRRLRSRRGETIATVATTAALTALIVGHGAGPLLVVITPLAIWAAFRLGTGLAAAVCAAAALVALVMMGPLGGAHAGDVALVPHPYALQGFLAVMTFAALMVALAWDHSRAAQRAVRLIEERFHDFAESAGDRFWETDEQHRFTWLSRPGRRTGIDRNALLGKTRMEITGEDTLSDSWRAHHADLDAHRPFENFSYSIPGEDGRPQFRRISGKPVFDEDGAFKGYRGTSSAVTRSMETEVLATQLGRIVEESLNEIYVLDTSSLRFLLVNRGARTNLGYSMDELRGMSPADICVDLDERQLRDKFHELDANEQARLTVELVHRRKNGTTYPVEAHLQRVAVGQMPPVYIAVVLDISRRREVQAELAAKSLLLETTLDTMAQGICVYDRDLRLVAFNRKYIELLGFAEGFIQLGGRLEDHVRNGAERGLFGPGSPEQHIAERVRLARDGLSARRVYRRSDGLVIGSNRRPMPGGGFVTTFSDITHRQTTEEALQQSTLELQDTKASFEAAIKASRQILYDWNTVEDSVKWDGETDLILGYTAQELEGLPDWMELIHPEDRRTFVRARAQAVMAQDVFSLEYRVCRKDGRYIPVADRGVFLAGTRGGAKRIVGFISDMSAQKATEEALRQSDKLLAVGQLTGGIAHDFNNLLAIILGNIELLSEDLGDDPTHQRHIQTALTAAHRGAALTQRLLAFARKQPLQPRTTQINHLVSEMSELLRRSLDPSVSLEMVLAEDLWVTKIDPSGLENALLNLAINARDAMPRGGKLMLKTKNVRLDKAYAALHQDVRPGEYVMLSVTDTGAGMPPAVRDRAFEPFFTTKPVGQGSGLGLPMVYGFVKQSQGHAQIESEEEVGTTVRLFLPRDESDASQDAGEPVEEIQHGMGGGERVLVVEDNEDVRSLTNLVLNGLGYRTVLAGDARSALDILSATSDIDVLFTDIVLPGGTNGFELAQQARALRPRLKILYTSGYTNNAIMQNGAADDTIVLIAKPYRKADLAQKMRQVLAKEGTDGQR